MNPNTPERPSPGENVIIVVALAAAPPTGTSAAAAAAEYARTLIILNLKKIRSVEKKYRSR